MKLICASLIFVLASIAGAEANHPGTKIQECEAPFAACQAAGYKVGAHKKGDKEGADMGLWVDCIHAVADGKKQVPGVDQAAAQACKAAHKARKASK
ncbi:MAG: hypothetical protein ACXVB4_14935 [Pseudobdellovibrionaceae bacterium]